MTTGESERVICDTCGVEVLSSLAEQMPDGTYICLVCLEESLDHD